ncbi:MAG TPA: cell division protein FtsQ/DivIB [Casimicrobiaceae bacterium]|nr:cell division protein FtsQ/DivIB [Casimicrobiaceae bacterium]
MWGDAKALAALAMTLTIMATLALLLATLGWLARQPAFAIREVVVTTPLKRASAPHLESIIREEIGGTFFTLDLERARSVIGNVPWVRRVAVRRQWPQRLEIAVEEHEPLARFADIDLVSTHGELFRAAYEGRLPRFAGPRAQAAEMTQRYREWSATLATLSLEIDEVTMSARGGWRVRALGESQSLTLDLGRDDTDARLNRFVAAYGKTVGALARQGRRIEYVDLRYRNGFAARVPDFREASSKGRG